jgi:hypothetical protein
MAQRIRAGQTHDEHVLRTREAAWAIVALAVVLTVVVPIWGIVAALLAYAAAYALGSQHAQVASAAIILTALVLILIS